MLRIRDIMTKRVYTVDADASAEEAAWGLTRRHIGGAPARDAQGNLVGVLSSSDLVNPEPAQWIRGEATVGDLMNPDVVSLYADDPAMTAVIERSPIRSRTWARSPSIRTSSMNPSRRLRALRPPRDSSGSAARATRRSLGCWCVMRRSISASETRW